MKPPDHQPRPAFTKAQDKFAAWRIKQKAALQQKELEEYQSIFQEAEKKKKEKAQELERTRQKRIEEEKNRLMLSRQELALRMFPNQPTKESKAKEWAADVIAEKDAYTLNRITQEAIKEGDNFLETKKRERENLPKEKDQTLSKNFTHASTFGKSKGLPGPMKDKDFDRER